MLRSFTLALNYLVFFEMSQALGMQVGQCHLALLFLHLLKLEVF